MADESKGIHLFSSGFEWDNFEARNCSKCVKEPTCDLILAMFGGGVINDLPVGSVTAEVAERLGWSDEYIGVLGWPCKERQADAAPPTPAATAMKQAGASMLPGFDVPARPAEEGRRPWTA